MDDELREKIIDILYGEDVWVPQARWEKIIMPLISELEKLRAAEQPLAVDDEQRVPCSGDPSELTSPFKSDLE